ncbi:MAG: tetratricopeptide repeat protein [Lentisphaerae bacterium]|nr:tetratricopeptide repeat protein [Lentisphaerota bacterium]
MSMRQQAFLRRLALGLLLLAGLPAEAFSLFPGRKDEVATHLRRADALLARADAAYEAGETDVARRFYGEALKRYEVLQESQPDLHEGLPRFRVDYCREQLANLDQMPAGTGTEPAPAETGKRAPRRGLQQFFRRDRPSETNAAPSTWVTPEPVRAAPPAPPPGGSDPAASAANAGQVATPVRDTVADTAEAEPAREPVDPAVIAADLREARVLLEDEQLADATRLLVGVLRADPGNRSARLMIAFARARQGRHDEALVALEDLRGQNEDLPLLLALSAVYCGAGRFFDAMLVLDKAIKLAPADPRAYLNLSWLHLAMNEGETGRRDAEAYYRRAVRLGARRDRALEVKLGLE